LIPAKLEECDMPLQLQGWQWVDLFVNKKSFIEAGYSRLILSLQARAENIGALQPKQIEFLSFEENRDTNGFEVLRFSDLSLDIGSRLASRGDRTIYLPKTEYLLLKLFLENPNKVLGQKYILENAWENKLETDSNIVEVYVRYLRQKLEKNGEPRLIQTVRGMGYVLREEA
jgi:DNA-binding response OmpR family regulator